MVGALVDRELEKFDDALADAARRSQAARAWLTLSSPSAADRELYLALAVVLTAVSNDTSGLASKLQRAVTRWDAVLESELRSSDQALLVRLVGDGLLLNALAGTPVPPERVEALAEKVLPR